MLIAFRPLFATLLALFVFIGTGAAIAGEAVTLNTADDVTVHGTLTRAKTNNNKILLLFHQARANRHEYDPMVPALTETGYDTLAIDQRAGGNLFGGRNETVAGVGASSGYLDALPDLEATLEWADTRGYDTIVAVGSSYSASLVILLAARYPETIDAVASFSPGEYFDDKDLVKDAAAKVTVPFYITAAPNEADNVTTVLAKAEGDHIVRYIPEAGVHGASTLVAARSPAGHAQNLQQFTDFLERVGR